MNLDFYTPFTDLESFDAVIGRSRRLMEKIDFLDPGSEMTGFLQHEYGFLPTDNLPPEDAKKILDHMIISLGDNGAKIVVASLDLLKALRLRVKLLGSEMPAVEKTREVQARVIDQVNEFMTSLRQDFKRPTDVYAQRMTADYHEVRDMTIPTDPGQAHSLYLECSSAILIGHKKVAEGAIRQLYLQMGLNTLVLSNEEIFQDEYDLEETEALFSARLGPMIIGHAEYHYGGAVSMNNLIMRKYEVPKGVPGIVYQ